MILDYQNLKLLNAHDLLASLAAIPQRPGVYLLFLNGGMRLLRATGYFQVGPRRLISVQNAQHVYTGAAHNLRDRIEQHLRRDWRGSSFRKTLLAMQYARRAISKTRTPGSKVVGESTLTAWLRDNLRVAVIPTRAPFDVERKLIAATASPLNIAQRRRTGYPRRLAQWRRQAFAPDVCQRWYR